jgi:hypothetical protein
VLKGLDSTKSYDFKVTAVDPYTGATFSSNKFTITTTLTPGGNNVLSNAKFTDTAGAIIVTFSNATDRAGHGGNRFKCNELFDVASSIRLGGAAQGAHCQFSSVKRLRIELYSESTIEPGGQLKLRANVIAKVTAGSSATEVELQYLGGEATVGKPTHTLMPGPLVTGPTTVGVCTTLLLDASQTTGSGGRKMKEMEWAVTCDGFRCDDLKTHLLALTNEPVISVGRTLLEGGRTFVFTVNATNFLGEEAASAGISVSKATVALPEVTIMGQTSLVAFRSERVHVRAAVVLPPPCDGASRESSAMNVEWSFKAIEEGYGESPDAYLKSVTTSVQDANAENTDQRVFTIAANTLMKVAKVSYRLTVTAAAQETPAAKNSAGVTVNIKEAGLVAAIDGGSLRRVGVDDPVVVSAAGSLDPDDPFGRGPGALSFVWSCTDKKAGGNCKDALSTNDIVLPTTPTLVLNDRAGSWLAFNTTYELGVTVCAKGGNCTTASRKASAATAVEVGAGSPPEVGISYCALEAGKLECGKPVPPKVNPSDKLVLQAIVTTKDADDRALLSTEWSELEQQLSSTSAYFSTPLVGVVGSAQLGMALKNGVLVANGLYTFRFEATNSRTGATGLSQVQVLANAPPSSGGVRAMACPVNSTGVCSGGRIGYAASTDFEISSMYWVDDADDLPLTYSFGFFITVAAEDEGAQEPAPSPLGHQSSSNRLTTQFPLGPNITIIGTVYDRLGASAEGSDEVMVTIKPGVKASTLVEEAEGALEGMLEQADGEQVSRLQV